MNRLDKPSRVGDRVVLTKHHYPELPPGTTGTIARIPQERWRQNEVTVAWDEGRISTSAALSWTKLRQPINLTV